MDLKVEIDSFSYSDQNILSNIHFHLLPGEHLSILGESGCGKSTLLHLIYGLLHLDHGQIHADGIKLLGPTSRLIPGEPFMKLVAQEFNIMPFSTVSENLRSHLSGMDEMGDFQRIDQLLEVVELEPHRDTLVKNLSGGQKQRVALAKALAKEPEILLLDEPFSNIDSFRKNKLRRRLFNYLKEKNICCITATHDSEEALAFSDYILMLKNGTTEMLGTPEEVYKSVSDKYQAGFFDDANFLAKNLISDQISSEEIIVFPHQLKVSTLKTPLPVQIVNAYFKGTHYLLQGTFQNQHIFFRNPERIEIGSDVFLEYVDGLQE